VQAFGGRERRPIPAGEDGVLDYRDLAVALLASQKDFDPKRFI